MQQENEIEIRRLKGMEIAKTCRITKREQGGYLVPSQTGRGSYVVSYINLKPHCTCPDFEKRGVLIGKCKHCWAVEIIINKQVDADGTTTITKTMRITYPQNWSAYNLSQTHQTELFMELLHDLTKDLYKPYVFGRPSLNLGEVIFCSALKVYSTLSSRRTVMNYKTALEKGYITKKPHFNAVSKLLNKEELTPILLHLIELSSLPLRAVEQDFTVDASGFSTCRFDRWFNFKYGKEISSRIWIKAHILSGTKTNIITGVKITRAYHNDSPQFPDLVEMTKKNFQIKELSADMGYLSYRNMKLIDDLGGKAYIPFKSSCVANASKKKLWRKMYHFFHLNREEFLQHYHKRSNAETVFHMIKTKFGDYVRSNNPTAQENEVLLKVLCHNICVVISEMHELGIEPNFCT